MKDPNPAGKRVCRLNAYRHELTGQMCVMSTDEQKAYDKHSKITLDALAPWSFQILRPPACSSASTTPAPPSSTTLSPSPAPGSKISSSSPSSCSASSVPSIRPGVSRDRPSPAQKGVKWGHAQGQALHRLAQAEGKPYRPEAFFVAAPESVESVFSTSEVVRGAEPRQTVPGRHKLQPRRQTSQEGQASSARGGCRQLNSPAGFHQIPT